MTALPNCSAADNAWILVSSALVLMMTAPGLALFYCGLVRKKNVLSVMMQCVFMMCLMTVIWALYGYSLVFGGNQPWIGDFSYLLMHGVNAEWTSAGPHLPIVAGTTLYTMTHMIYQGMFFIITPTLICGAFAERMKFSTMVVFMVLWGTLIYCPLAHWLWGNGGALSFTGDPDQVAAGRGDRFRRRHRGPYQFRSIGAGMRLDVGQATWATARKKCGRTI